VRNRLPNRRCLCLSWAKKLKIFVLMRRTVIVLYRSWLSWLYVLGVVSRFKNIMLRVMSTNTPICHVHKHAHMPCPQTYKGMPTNIFTRHDNKHAHTKRTKYIHTYLFDFYQIVIFVLKLNSIAELQKLDLVFV
jgi:hypothetical protein